MNENCVILTKQSGLSFCHMFMFVETILKLSENQGIKERQSKIKIPIGMKRSNFVNCGSILLTKPICQVDLKTN